MAISIIWPSGVLVMTAAQLHSVISASNPVRDLLEIRDYENLWCWPQVEIRLKPFAGQPFRKKSSRFFIITKLFTILKDILENVLYLVH